MFNACLRAGDLPFGTEAGEVWDAEGRLWSNFGLQHAAALLAADQLVGAGLSWREAAWTLREPRIPVPRSANARQDGSHFVARAEFLREGGGEPDFRPRYAIYSGTLHDIVAAAQRDVGAYNQGSARSAYQKIGLTALVAATWAGLGAWPRCARTRWASPPSRSCGSTRTPMRLPLADRSRTGPGFGS
ncbi:hypothetical protein Rumeso_02707 [Rubellimicrobium mesophilum DSM 19309]|uniref:Uncharacterized protein n=1 Tax=Rubellimicrobium mesophilum DSM 19309 TaxID=442562 RepID=A0A017HMT8_9RHOB|nr:hypothetical protein [Rubellimicrobium mesophilum]EYD75620.1 hypothetical protein Rumeso_02707 [Rubellimicrobium mesophilum DSM 19309]